MIDTCFTRGLTEFNFKRKVAPSLLREEGCGLFSNYIKPLGVQRVVKYV